ncbi:Uncharacterised protein [Urinicoccus massiliensis]|uniref:N-acetylmuramoyl-L-alanine amidase n=2 Tax=Urinicoccus massiliensis TaxID=1723382 RepID=A0A8H2M7J4_9FIRM|nr:Uncharacterised protein [Urinicoccus massiliensis]
MATISIYRGPQGQGRPVLYRRQDDCPDHWRQSDGLAVGDKWGYKNNPNRIKDAKNINTLSLELCINRDCDPVKAYKNLVELTKNLMAKFKVPGDCVIRHFDVTGKTCPGSWSGQNWAKWWQFKEDIKGPIEWAIDLSKDSSFGPGVTKKEDKPMTSWGMRSIKRRWTWDYRRDKPRQPSHKKRGSLYDCEGLGSTGHHKRGGR